MRKYRELRLKLGVAALIEGVEARALDDVVALEGAAPTGLPGALEIEPIKLRARRDVDRLAEAGAGRSHRGAGSFPWSGNGNAASGPTRAGKSDNRAEGREAR